MDLDETWQVGLRPENTKPCTFQRNRAMGFGQSANKKAQLSLTNPRDACEKFARFTYKSSGVVSCIARLPIDSLPMVFYYVLYSNYL